MTKVFIIGATGYIGGALLVALKRKYPDFNYTALVRSESYIEAIRSAGATVVQGSFADVDVISEQSEQADIVINVGDCDDLELTLAILKGLKARHTKGLGVGTLLHTSGTGIFIDENSAKFDPNAKVWTDSEEDIKLLTPSMLHGPADVAILKAGGERYINNFTICPSIVHGTGDGPITRTALMVRNLVKLMLKLKHGIIIGDGKNSFGWVNIKDVIPAFLLVLERALEAKSVALTSSPYSRFFIVSSVQKDWKTMLASITDELYKRGKLESSELLDTPVEVLGFTGEVASSRSLVRSERLKDLGWVPKEPEFEETVASDVDVVLAELE
ncbi:NAD-binding protein [Phellopilus nigrolimitatus]|nr:NAD-binding protein [Phellopilus nigrolimitatus]